MDLWEHTGPWGILQATALDASRHTSMLSVKDLSEKSIFFKNSIFSICQHVLLKLCQDAFFFGSLYLNQAQQKLQQVLMENGSVISNRLHTDSAKYKIQILLLMTYFAWVQCIYHKEKKLSYNKAVNSEQNVLVCTLEVKRLANKKCTDLSCVGNWLD